MSVSDWRSNNPDHVRKYERQRYHSRKQDPEAYAKYLAATALRVKRYRERKAAQAVVAKSAPTGAVIKGAPKWL